MMGISKKLKEYIDYDVAPDYYKNLSKKGIDDYEKKLIRAIKLKQRIKI